jgi:hypothetical protein
MKVGDRFKFEEKGSRVWWPCVMEAGTESFWYYYPSSSHILHYKLSKEKPLNLDGWTEGKIDGKTYYVKFLGKSLS